MNPYTITLANLSAQERFALEEVVGLFADDQHAPLKRDFLHGTRGIALHPDTGEIISVRLEPEPEPAAVPVRHVPARHAATTTGFSLVELLTVVAVISVLVAMLLPATVRAFHHASARAAWTAYWTQARATAFAQDDLPESSAAYWLQTPDQAWDRINGARGITWEQVSRERVQVWRDSTRALAANR